MGELTKMKETVIDEEIELKLTDCKGKGLVVVTVLL